MSNERKYAKICVGRFFRNVDDCQFYIPEKKDTPAQFEFAKALGRPDTECHCDPTKKTYGTEKCPFFKEESSDSSGYYDAHWK